MDPLYEYTDGQLLMKVFIVITGLGLMALGFSPVPADAPLWLVLVVRFMILFGPMIMVLTPQIRLRAFPDHIEITYGLGSLIRFRLENERIVSVRAVTYDPIKDFGGWGIKGGVGQWHGWIAFTASVNNKGLAIETTGKNYLLGCPNPEEAETMLRNIVGRE